MIKVSKTIKIVLPLLYQFENFDMIFAKSSLNHANCFLQLSLTTSKMLIVACEWEKLKVLDEMFTIIVGEVEISDLDQVHYQGESCSDYYPASTKGQPRGGPEPGEC